MNKQWAAAAAAFAFAAAADALRKWEYGKRSSGGKQLAMPQLSGEGRLGGQGGGIDVLPTRPAERK